MTNRIFIHVSPVSVNAKTGPIPVTTSSKNTCPDSCQLKGNGCYAEVGRVNIHWQKVSNGKPRVIIGFPAHGIAKKKAEKVFMMKRENT